MGVLVHFCSLPSLCHPPYGIPCRLGGRTRWRRLGGQEGFALRNTPFI